MLCAQLTRDLFAIATFLVCIEPGRVGLGRVTHRVNCYRVGSALGSIYVTRFQLCNISLRTCIGGLTCAAKVATQVIV